MRSVRYLTLAGMLAAFVACEQESFTSDGGPDAPPPPLEGIQAYIHVDNQLAQPGERIHVQVRVQVGSGADVKVGSYTGRLQFDSGTLTFLEEVQIDDGMRVTNPEGAADGLLRFAGAAPRGFATLTLYEAVFEVQEAGFADGLAFEMEELSEALSLTNLQPQLSIAPQVFFSRTGN